jgi:hypothetical protein
LLNEAYVGRGLREFLLSDQSRPRCGTIRQPPYLRPLLLEEEIVSVKSISSLKFNRFLPTRNHLRTAIGKEVEWYADDPENSIGTIAFSKEERGWNYAILRRDWMGDFQVSNLKANFRNSRTASVDCVLMMRDAEKGGQRTLSEITDG